MSAVFLLDSDICIYAMTRRSPEVMARFDRLLFGEARIPIVAYGELLFGLSKSRTKNAASSNLALLTSKAPVDQLPAAAARNYAEIRRHLEAAGTPIGANDIWIAAHARAAGLVLVTNNEREFRRVPGLEIENWLESKVREKSAVYSLRRRKAVARSLPSDAAPVDPAADLRQVVRGR